MAPCEKERVRALFEAVYRETFSGAVPCFEETTKGEQIYIAVTGDNIAGFSTIWEQDAFIHYLFVAPGFRRQKIGRAMVERIAAWYDRPLTLKCLAGNSNAIAFYRASGWKEIGTGIGEDGPYLLMRYLNL